METQVEVEQLKVAADVHHCRVVGRPESKKIHGALDARKKYELEH